MPMYRTQPSSINLDGFNEGLSAIGKAFAPPTPQEIAVSQKAAADARKAAAVQRIRGGSSNTGDYVEADVSDPARQSAIADMISRARQPGANPRGFDAENYVVYGNAGNTFAGIDVNNAAQMARTQVEQRGQIERAMLAPIPAGGTRLVPKTIGDAFGGMPEVQTGVVDVSPGNRATLADGRVIEGAPKPMTMDETRALILRDLPENERRVSALHDVPTENVVGADGRPQIAFRADAVGQQPAPPQAAPSELSRLQAERAALPPGDPRIAEYDSKIAAGGRGTTPDPYRDTSDRALATRHDEIAKAGAAAGAMNGNLDRLETLLADVPTGALAERKLQVAKYAQDLGLGDVASSLMGGKTDQAQAANAIVQRLAPGLRVPGSGAQSDRELKNFIASLPSLGNTPGGNKIIVETLRAASRQQQQAAEIARKSQAGILDRYEADRQIAALSAPFARFAGGGSKDAPAPTSIPAPTPGATPPQTAAPVRVSSPAEARQLPSGTPIILPDGSTGRVP